MHICFIGPATSTHLKKICKWFIDKNHIVDVITFSDDSIENARVHYIDLGVDPQSNDIKKIKYLLAGKKIKKVIDSIKPDVINVHYASSYGTSVALSGMDNYILYVWGSDIYDFPQKSAIHRFLLSYSLNQASLIISTSQVMAKELKQYTNNRIIVIPFGVDLNLFHPRVNKSTDKLIIGTVKSMSNIYGIDTLIRAIALYKERYGSTNINVRIVGDGPNINDFKNLVCQLQLTKEVSFLGNLPQSKVAEEWSKMDIAVIPSRKESFGVSALEAQACGLPIIVSSAPGLLETTIPGSTSLVYPIDNEYELLNQLRYLITNPLVREAMGNNGRKYVEDNYEMNNCFYNLESHFTRFIEAQ